MKLNIFKTIRELNDKDDDTIIELVDPDDDVSDDYFDRGDLDLARRIAPEGFSWERDYVRIGDEYATSFYIHKYPSQVDDAWLHSVLHFEHPLDVAIYVQPLPRDSFIKSKENMIAQDKASIERTLEESRRPDAKKVRRIADLQELLNAIQNDITKPYHLMVVMTLRAASPEDLDRIAKELRSRMSNIELRRVEWKHKQGFETTMPLATNELMDTDNVRLAHTQSVMAMYPFTSSDITHETGVLMGISRGTQTPIIVNRFFQPPEGNLESPNSAIFGKSGSGKSFLAKMEMTRWSYKGVGIIVLDPSGEYTRVCQALGGDNINISLDSKDRINPLDFSYAVEPGRNALRTKIAAMSDLLRVMLRSGSEKTEIDAVTKKIFDNALIETYRHRGYDVQNEASQIGATPDNMPRLSDVVTMLHRIQRADRRPQVQDRITLLIAGLDRFVGDGPLAELFDNQSTIDLRNSHFINFNISGVTQMSTEFVPMAMQLVLEFLRTSMFTDAQQEGRYGNKLLYVDEAQHLMGDEASATFLAATARTCRKYGIGLTVMTQDVGVFVLADNGGENKVGRAILANCSTTVLLKQHPNELNAVKRAFNLTPGEISRLHSAQIGEGLIIVGQDSAWFSARGLAHEAEERIFETSVTARRAYADEDNALLPGGLEGDGGVSSSFILPSDFSTPGYQLPAPQAPQLPAGDDPFGDAPAWDGGGDLPQGGPASPFEPLP